MNRHKNAGRKQSPEHIARRIESTRKTKATWTEDRDCLFRKRVSKAVKGRPAWNKGVPQSDEQRKKNSEAHKGIFAGEKHPMFGKRMTPEHKRKLLKANIGRRQSPGTIAKRFAWRNGYSHSEETKKKIGLANKGSNNGMWEGGISHEEYPAIWWNKNFKEMIRDRDNHECQLCGIGENDRKHDVHHIDYNKKNTNPINLITLCRSCHGKTNFNRDEWQLFFNERLNAPLTGTNN